MQLDTFRTASRSVTPLRLSLSRAILLITGVIREVGMKRKWQAQRQTVARSDGQLRWNRAYQLLLHATQAPEAAPPLLPEQLPMR